jgi:hypothetical protein
VIVFSPGVEYVTSGGLVNVLDAGKASAPKFHTQLPDEEVFTNFTLVFKQTVSGTVKLAVGLPMLIGTL